MNHAEQWLDGRISMGKLLELEGVPLEQGSSLVGGIWQAFQARAYALDKELARRIETARVFQGMAEGGDTKQTVPSDIKEQPIRIAHLQEAKALLRFHLLGCIDRTQAGK